METGSGNVTPRTRVFQLEYPRTPGHSLLGRGAFGIAFAVQRKDEPCSRFVAKEVWVAQLSVKQQMEAFNEAELLQKLSRRSVVACVDAILTGSCLYIIMECAGSGDLARHIRERQECCTGLEPELFDEAVVMAVFVKVCDALRYIHEQKILHRDLKPPNIFVFGDGDLSSCDVKLGDFGLGKVFDSTTFEAISSVGTPFYFSPELCKGHKYGRRSDIWSLGVVLYELACLAVPFKAKIPAIAVMICKTEPKALPSHYSAELVALVQALLQKDPQDRPLASEILQQAFVSDFCPDWVLDWEPASTRRSPGISPTGVKRGGEVAVDGGENAADEAPACGALPEDDPLPKCCETCPENDACENDILPGMDAVLEVFKTHDDDGGGTIPQEDLMEVLSSIAPELHKDLEKTLSSSGGAWWGDVVKYSDFLEWVDREAQ